MSSNAIALLISTAALGFAVFTVVREPDAKPTRTASNDARVAELERTVEALRYEVAALRGLPLPSAPDGTPRTDAQPGVGLPSAPTEERDPALAAMVDDAVDRKAKQVMEEMRIKANKKPELAVFAKMLGLSKEQVAATERVVVEGQRDVHQILEVPTADGRNLMNDLVDLMAKGMAEPGRDHGWGAWVGRVMQEKVPGTDQTYGAQIEAVKQRMRQTFEREWSKEQYAEFRAWGVDPTEIQKVPDSPNEQLWARIVDRARALGAQIPNSD